MQILTLHKFCTCRFQLERSTLYVSQFFSVSLIWIYTERRVVTVIVLL